MLKQMVMSIRILILSRFLSIIIQYLLNSEVWYVKKFGYRLLAILGLIVWLYVYYLTLSYIALYPPSVISHVFVLPLTVLTISYIAYGMMGKLPPVKIRNIASAVVTGIIMFGFITTIPNILPYIFVFPTRLLVLTILFLFSIDATPTIIYGVKGQKFLKNFQTSASFAS